MDMGGGGTLAAWPATRRLQKARLCHAVVVSGVADVRAERYSVRTISNGGSLQLRQKQASALCHAPLVCPGLLACASLLALTSVWRVVTVHGTVELLVMNIIQYQSYCIDNQQEQAVECRL
ncbi:hypothetical protein JTB14_015083 [Gonioctena quinquepunctata]|nr:hypothetical protein JTB14_015083 [Gonioctena quinquepunctata]